jgi:GTP cyclohydrolase I
MNPSAPIINPDVRAKNIAGLTEELLLQVGEDPKREGLLRTPERVAKAWQELTAGYRVDVDKLINGALFDEPYSEMVVVRDIQFFSLCEHHLLPFFGVCHVAYLPQGKILGLSKIPKLVKAFARRLQVQERLTNEIAETLDGEGQSPRGGCGDGSPAHVHGDARGGKSATAPPSPAPWWALFRSDARTRDEFLSLIRRR